MIIRIFILDDDSQICDVLSDLFGIEGHSTIIASSIKEAGDLIKTEFFDLALIDFKVGDGEGTGIIRLIRSERPEAKIIGMSGTEESRTFYDAGADSFIKKPFVDIDILKVVRSTVRDSGTQN